MFQSQPPVDCPATYNAMVVDGKVFLSWFTMQARDDFQGVFRGPHPVRTGNGRRTEEYDRPKSSGSGYQM
jgi:hypothetical protein